MTGATIAARGTRDEGLLGVLGRGNLGVVLVACLLLAGGWLLRGRALSERVRYQSRSVTLEHPVGWLETVDPAAGRDREATVIDLVDAGSFRSRIAIGREPHPAGLKERDLASYLTLNLQRSLSLFHLIRERSVRIDGRPGLRLDYAYALNPAARPDDPAATDVPVVIAASTLATITRDGAIVRVSVEQLSARRESAGSSLADRILGSVQLRSGGSR